MQYLEKSKYRNESIYFLAKYSDQWYSNKAYILHLIFITKSTTKTDVCTLLIRDHFMIFFSLEANKNNTKGWLVLKFNSHSMTIYESADKKRILNYTESSSINTKNLFDAQVTLKYLTFWIIRHTKQFLKLFKIITIQFLTPKKIHFHDSVSIKMLKLAILLSLLIKFHNYFNFGLSSDD